MDGDHFNEFISKKFLGLAVLIALAVWAALTYLFTPFVPTDSVFWGHFWAAFTATPIVGVVFFATNMFWIVARENQQAKDAA